MSDETKNKIYLIVIVLMSAYLLYSWITVRDIDTSVFDVEIKKKDAQIEDMKLKIIEIKQEFEKDRDSILKIVALQEDSISDQKNKLRSYEKKLTFYNDADFNDRSKLFARLFQNDSIQ